MRLREFPMPAGPERQQALDAEWHGEDALAVELGAFVTGSRAYGTPRPDSDLDLVLMASVGAVAALKLNGWQEGPSASGGGHPGSTSLMHPDNPGLNLIVCHNLARFDSWRVGTEQLRDEAPVTRERAVEVFKALFRAERLGGDA